MDNTERRTIYMNQRGVRPRGTEVGRFDSMTVTQLQEALRALQVPFRPKERKPELRALLEGASTDDSQFTPRQRRRLKKKARRDVLAGR